MNRGPFRWSEWLGAHALCEFVRFGSPPSLTFFVRLHETSSDPGTHGGAIPPLILSGYLVVGSLVGGIVLMCSKRPGRRWAGAGLLILAFTGTVLLLVFLDAFVKFFADANLLSKG